MEEHERTVLGMCHASPSHFPSRVFSRRFSVSFLFGLFSGTQLYEPSGYIDYCSSCERIVLRTKLRRGQNRKAKNRDTDTKKNTETPEERERAETVSPSLSMHQATRHESPPCTKQQDTSLTTTRTKERKKKEHYHPTLVLVL